MGSDRPTARPPALTRASSKSFDCPDVFAFTAALLAAGGEQVQPSEAELARFRFYGGLAMVFHSGKIVLGGPDPAQLAALLDLWALEVEL